MSEQTKQSLDPAVLEQLAAQSNRVTNEELLLAAMFGKQLQTDINGIKKQSAEVGGSLKVTDVDMAKVMPSHILPAMGIKAPKQPQRLPAQSPVQQTFVPAPSYPEVGVPNTPNQLVFMPAPVNTSSLRK